MESLNGGISHKFPINSELDMQSPKSKECIRHGDIMDITYPMAYVRQSADGASAVIGIWSIVLAEMCSEVMGSNKITFP